MKSLLIIVVSLVQIQVLCSLYLLWPDLKLKTSHISLFMSWNVLMKFSFTQVTLYLRIDPICWWWNSEQPSLQSRVKQFQNHAKLYFLHFLPHGWMLHNFQSLIYQLKLNSSIIYVFWFTKIENSDFLPIFSGESQLNSAKIDIHSKSLHE